MANYVSPYTGTQIDDAIGRALNWEKFASVTTNTIDSISYTIYWKIAPTSSNTVYGVAITDDGQLKSAVSTNGTVTIESSGGSVDFLTINDDGQLCINYEEASE